MTNKQRSRLRHKNNVAWKKAQKLQKSLAAASPESATNAAPPAESAPPAPTSAAPAPENSPAPSPTPGHPGALIPYDPAAPVDCKLLFERLSFGGSEVTNEERIAIAHRLEQRYFEPPLSLSDPQENEASLLRTRSMLARALHIFGIDWVTLSLAAMSARFYPNPSPHIPAADIEAADTSPDDLEDDDLSHDESPAASSNPALSSAPPSYAPRHSPGHSTGPRSFAGKLRSSQNARTHGLSSLTSVFVLLPGEDPKEWLELLHDLTHEFKPVSRTENILVTDMAQSYWLTQRAISLQTRHIEDPKSFALFIRYQTTHQRAYYRALKQLLALQKARAKSGSPAITDYPAPRFDATLDPSTIPSLEPEPGSPDPPEEPIILPQAA
jgi:hypothetical protein